MNRHTSHIALTVRDSHPLGGRADAIQIGLTDDGKVAVVLDPRAAQELAQLVARRDPTTPPDALLEAERDPDDTTWTHVVVDLLATSVMTRLDDFAAGVIDSAGQPVPGLRLVGSAR